MIDKYLQSLGRKILSYGENVNGVGIQEVPQGVLQHEKIKENILLNNTLLVIFESGCSLNYYSCSSWCIRNTEATRILVTEQRDKYKEAHEKYQALNLLLTTKQSKSKESDSDRVTSFIDTLDDKKQTYAYACPVCGGENLEEHVGLSSDGSNMAGLPENVIDAKSYRAQCNKCDTLWRFPKGTGTIHRYINTRWQPYT